MTNTKQAQTMALIAACEAIIEGVKESGKEGIPGGTLYALLMPYGCSLSAFELIMSSLVKAGKLTKRGKTS